jgi:hypothetical protein
MQAVTMSVGGTSRPQSRPRGRAWRSKRGRSEAHARVLALSRTLASEAPMCILGMGAESDVSTVLRGRRRLIELDWRCWVDAHDCQFTGCRSAGVHVELEVSSPGIRSTCGASAMLDATGLNGAGGPAERRRGTRRTGSGKDSCPGHDGGRERTRAWLRSPEISECDGKEQHCGAR